MSSRFNDYMRSHFSGCQLLAEGFDTCRSREVRVFMLPGYHKDVGFSDGTDAWIVPIAAESCTGGAGSLLKNVNLRELMGRILNGEKVSVVRGSEMPQRRRVSLDTDPPRRRIATEQEPQPEIQRRRHVSI